ncbi:MAG: hypothetical protein HY021_01180, partial [Burkholderiales bacterium]|nr:hypothetical protein [Burkholderiales bacterium]
MIPRRILVALGLLAVGAAALAQPQAAPPITSRELLNAVLWQQITVEYRASALSAYRLATSRLDAVKVSGATASMEQLAMGGYRNKKPAVVLDIDETVLDNMPYDALLVQQGRPWPDPDWEPWVAAAQAHAVPGVRGFVARARAKGFRVVFITDRDCRVEGGYDANGQALVCPQKEATLRNLTSALGYRPAAADLMLRGERQGRDDVDKQARRAELARTHRIALQVGDDLKDFIRTTDYDPDKHGAHWGTRWIILPNAVYGSWEKPMRGDLAKKYAALQPWVPPVVPPAARLKLLSWNLEWFADPQSLIAGDFWGQCAARNFPNEKLQPEWPFCDVYKKDGILNAADYEAKKLVPLRARLAELGNGSADVLAVQETQGPAALQSVLPAGWRVACFSTRVDAQNVGFALRDAAGLTATCREIPALSLEGQPGVTHPVRRGLELTV